MAGPLLHQAGVAEVGEVGGAVFGGTRTAAARGVQSLLEAETSGPDLLSGGGSGLDGSVFAATLCLAVAAALLVLAHRRGRFEPPFWQRWRAS